MFVWRDKLKCFNDTAKCIFSTAFSSELERSRISPTYGFDGNSHMWLLEETIVSFRKSKRGFLTLLFYPLKCVRMRYDGMLPVVKSYGNWLVSSTYLSLLIVRDKCQQVRFSLKYLTICRAAGRNQNSKGSMALVEKYYLVH